MTNITQAQARLLTRAAVEPEGAIDALRDTKRAKALIKKGLAISLPVEGGASRLIITEAGRLAIAQQTGVDNAFGSASDAADDVTGERKSPAEAPPPTDQMAAGESPKGKLGALVGLLKRPQGTGVEEMMTATGWQAHSVRGAMSGALKKKLGMTIESEKTETGRVYRIPSEVRA